MNDTFSYARPTLPFLLRYFCNVAALHHGMLAVDVESVDVRTRCEYGLDNDQTARFGRKGLRAERPCHVSDLHATNPHLMGLDHQRLIDLYGDANQTLPGVEPREVIQKVLV